MFTRVAVSLRRIDVTSRDTPARKKGLSVSASNGGRELKVFMGLLVFAGLQALYPSLMLCCFYDLDFFIWVFTFTKRMSI
jgi:hypothetical protein